ncbi:MAG: DUF3369 domain-containing protein [Nitrospirae bacterium]|nr:DUF3369 domain-containing protein [Nitrospirota bacterium]
MFDDDNFFYEESQGKESQGTENPASGSQIVPSKWKCIVADDDIEVHNATVLALKRFSFDDKGLEFIHAYSGGEAIELIRIHPDTAIMFLDVVMETDNSGLHVVQYVRDVLKNRFVRIVLRTGQPGQAPEESVIVDYDINDYKEKSELTIQKLNTTVISSLRSYRDILTIDMHGKGLRRIIDSSSSLFKLQSMETFASGVLVQLIALMNPGLSSMFCKNTAFSIEDGAASLVIIAGTGKYEKAAGKRISDVVSPNLLEIIDKARKEKIIISESECCAICFRTNTKLSTLFYLENCPSLSELERQLVEVFTTNVSVAFENVFLYGQLTGIQRAAIESLAMLAEYKDTDTGDHVHRVAELSLHLSKNLLVSGKFTDHINELFIEHIGIASTLHDVGKVGVPEKILLKPGKLDPDEWEIMKQHTVIGGQILRNTARSIAYENYLSMAAEIAMAHHEKYNGGGYPIGLKGEDIPLSARIVAVVDVYDALVSKRPYKDPWNFEKVVELLKSERGEQFDPHVLDAFISVITQDV